MLRSYLKIAIRHVVREKGYSAINVLGIAIGMACCLVIALYVRAELSYDRFHEQSERIVRLIRPQSAMSAAPMGPAMAVALLSVGYQAVRAATRDPVRSLRYE